MVLVLEGTWASAGLAAPPSPLIWGVVLSATLLLNTTPPLYTH